MLTPEPEGFTVELQDGWQLTTCTTDADATLWLTRDIEREEFFEHAISPAPPLDELPTSPRLYFDYLERPYLFWDTPGLVFSWRCAQEELYAHVTGGAYS